VLSASGVTVFDTGIYTMLDLDMEFMIAPEFISNATFSVVQAESLLDTTGTSNCSLIDPLQVHTEYLNYHTDKKVCAETASQPGIPAKLTPFGQFGMTTTQLADLKIYIDK